LFGTLSFFPALAWTAGCTVAIIAVDGLFAAIARLLPAKWFPQESKLYKVGKKEKNFYEKLKIRKWKDKIPEIGHFTGFRKNKILEPNNPKYIERFLLECCYGEIGHFWSIIFGFLLLLFFFISDTWIAISIPVAIIAGGLNLLPFMTLRYNSYKLRVLRTSLLKKQKQEQNKIA
jgi:glycosyl-4,4'-diaponeurosporenoate acyltransferase